MSETKQEMTYATALEAARDGHVPSLSLFVAASSRKIATFACFRLFRFFDPVTWQYLPSLAQFSPTASWERTAGFPSAMDRTSTVRARPAASRLPVPATRAAPAAEGSRKEELVSTLRARINALEAEKKELQSENEKLKKICKDLKVRCGSVVVQRRELTHRRNEVQLWPARGNSCLSS